MEEPKNYLTFDEYRVGADSLYAVSGIILFSFAKNESDIKNQIIRNFVARAAMMLKGIFNLWEISDYQDAWIIHRGLLDRLFHLRRGTWSAGDEFHKVTCLAQQVLDLGNV